MKFYLLKRLIIFIPLILIISFITFSLMNLSSSDPAEVTLRINNVSITQEAIEEVRIELGLDKPFLQRYIIWLENAIKGDFGISYSLKSPVIDEILYALPTTLTLAFFTLILILLVGFGLGIICGLNEGKLLDKILRFFLFFSTAMPNFWLGLLLIYLFSVYFNLLPTSGFDNYKSMILPSITLSFAYISTYARLLRNRIIQTKEEPFVIFAKARGLKNSTINYHIIKNAIIPCIIALGMSIPKLIAGTVVIENIFGLPGLGSLCLHAIFGRDLPIIQAYILFMSCLFIFFNLFADIIARYIDPRLKKVI
ncbi:nickel ABC transporter permease subunit NikB [Arcobacter sp. FW59]|nr:nickel ABC transporter permease subunit NikB [Arcobacter sp. FW59]